MKKVIEQEKMSLSEYIDNYSSKPLNSKQTKAGLSLFATLIGVILVTCLFFLVLRVFELNEYAGYASIVVAVLVFIFLYIVPLIKLSSIKAFKVNNVKTSNARDIKRYNKSLRNDIASKMIDIASVTDDVSFYSDENIRLLAFAKQKHDDRLLKDTLTKIYDTDVRKNANVLIKKAAVNVGLTTALSQSDTIDTALVCIYDLNLIKQLVFLYGYRPSDAKMLKIYKTVIINALVAYGASSVITGSVSSAFSAITNVASKAAEKTKTILGGVLSTVLGSTSQGIINSTLTVIIGFQTKKYLINEYHLQDILDDIELTKDDEDAESAILSEVNKEVKSVGVNKSKEQ